MPRRAALASAVARTMFAHVPALVLTFLKLPLVQERHPTPVTTRRRCEQTSVNNHKGRGRSVFASGGIRFADVTARPAALHQNQHDVRVTLAVEANPGPVRLSASVGDP